ncbi:hypothetical protein NPX13_g5302 [Xylaria arbuscula]|uniref:Hsp70 family protein n=1 Tax=Xylaria arbuscula TaxID=114810 RepID=A0A9W8NDW5_9PEZI|nr:hypothetical protein NPX13_g5302 [Xylaria arbuscula]
MSPNPHYEEEQNHTNSEPEEGDDHTLSDTIDDDFSNRLILSIDFGTTYSAVSYIALRADPDFRKKANLNRPATSSASAADSETNDLADSPDTMDVDTRQHSILSLRPNPDDFKWGYTMHEAWANPVTHFKKTSKAMNRFKLLLDESERTQELRNSLQSTLDNLMAEGIVESEVGVIADFLTFLLRHVKKQLQSLQLYHDYDMELVLCIPAIWTQKACRNMQAALFIAMQSAQFKGIDHSCGAIENLFLVSEPEAAAAFTLDTDPDIHASIPAGQTFVLLDAGGGTVDANTYTVSQTQPLRLSEEVVAPGGGLCGSSYLNERFRIMLYDLLKEEKYLIRGKTTIEGIVERILMNEFEYKTKRQFDIYDNERLHETYYCAGLEDKFPRFVDDCIRVEHYEMEAIFSPCLEQIAKLMESQIKSTRLRGIRVDKVIVVGGFAGSPSLQGYLMRRPHSTDITSEIWNSESFDCVHTFGDGATELLCEEILYVSDTATVSQRPMDDPENRSK